jgi:ribonucleotide reductase alpha subunit
LIEALLERNLWNQEIRSQILAHNGSIQKIPQIPDDVKRLFRTVWELPQKKIIDLASGRAPFID